MNDLLEQALETIEKNLSDKIISAIKTQNSDDIIARKDFKDIISLLANIKTIQSQSQMENFAHSVCDINKNVHIDDKVIEQFLSNFQNKDT